MSQEKCMTFAEVLATIPDPRKKRGVRHAWKTSLLIISAGLLRGEHTLAGIGDGVHNHAAFWEEALDVPRLPSHATLRRTLRDIDVTALEEQLRQWAGTLVPQLSRPVHALALDAKRCVVPRKKASMSISYVSSRIRRGWCWAKNLWVRKPMRFPSRVIS